LQPANSKFTQLTPKTASVVPPEDGRLMPETCRRLRHNKVTERISESVFGPVLFPNMYWTVVFGVVVETNACDRLFLSARVDDAVVPVPCAVGIRKLPGAIKLLVPVGWCEQIFVRTTGGIRKPFDVRTFF
jgi:hypothetical protein